MNRAILFLCLVSCSKKEEQPKPFASDTLPVDARERVNAICDRLTSGGVAKNCKKANETGPTKLRGALAHVATFEPLGGFPSDKCTAMVFVDQKFATGARSDYAAAGIPEDDFPRKTTFATSAAMWPAAVSCDSDGTKWEKCREKKPVADCMKQAPEYAKYKALHERAAKVIDGK